MATSKCCAQKAISPRCMSRADADPFSGLVSTLHHEAVRWQGIDTTVRVKKCITPRWVDEIDGVQHRARSHRKRDHTRQAHHSTCFKLTTASHQAFQSQWPDFSNSLRASSRCSCGPNVAPGVRLLKNTHMFWRVFLRPLKYTVFPEFILLECDCETLQYENFNTYFFWSSICSVSTTVRAKKCLWKRWKPRKSPTHLISHGRGASKYLMSFSCDRRGLSC